MTVKTETAGKTEQRNIQRVKADRPAPPLGPWLFAGLCVMGLVIGGVLFASGKPEGTAAPLPTAQPAAAAVVDQPTTPEPAPLPQVTRPERNDNRNDADRGSVNINGDQNRVIIDNSQRSVTHHHHRHETREVVAEYVVTPRLKRTQLRRDNVPKHCNDSMAEHHETVAKWYREMNR